MSNPKFSVLISVYYKESASNLKDSLESIFFQTLLPSEVILVEDGPLTPSLYSVIGEEVAKHPEIKIISFEKNRGLGLALRDGLTACSYELVARMDSDDISKPDRFEKEIGFLINHTEISVVGSWVDEFEKEVSNVISVRQVPKTNMEIRSYARIRNPMNHPTVAFRKSDVINSGNYQNCPLFEDYFLWVRIMMGGFKLYNLQESLLYFRITPESYKRRGGSQYLIKEFNFQRKLVQIKFISFPIAVYNCIVRICIRLMPNKMRNVFYSKFLRASNK
jgi:glycosyltransferase involved in cell wall biosynthesis